MNFASLDDARHTYPQLHQLRAEVGPFLQSFLSCKTLYLQREDYKEGIRTFSPGNFPLKITPRKFPLREILPEITPCVGIVAQIQGRPSHGENEAEIFIIAILGGKEFFLVIVHGTVS